MDEEGAGGGMQFLVTSESGHRKVKLKGKMLFLVHNTNHEIGYKIHITRRRLWELV